MKKDAVKKVGTHIFGKIYSESSLLRNRLKLEELVIKLILESSFSPLGSVSHEFEGGGYTTAIIFAESHFTIHTWPEENFAMLDLFVCNHTKGNSLIANKLFESIVDHLSPVEKIISTVNR